MYGGSADIRISNTALNNYIDSEVVLDDRFAHVYISLNEVTLHNFNIMTSNVQLFSWQSSYDGYSLSNDFLGHIY